MKLNYRTINKLFQSIFDGVPLKAYDNGSKLELLDAMENGLKHIESVRLTNRYRNPYYSSKEMKLEIDYSDNCFSLYFDGSGLRIKDWYNDVPVSDVEQLIQFLDAVKGKYEEAAGRAAKREKILGLKDKAIESRLKTLAKEQRFAYKLRKYQNKVKLIIQIDKVNGIEIDIPYNRFQEVLNGVGELIRNIIDLYEQGLKFKIKPVQHVYRWKGCSQKGKDI